MTVTEISPQLEKLNFNPSLNEQLQLSKVHKNNLLFVYSKEESLIRILSLLILFYLNSQSNTDTPSKILIIMRRSWQSKIQTLLKSYINRKTTILKLLLDLTAKHRLPSMCETSRWAKSGCLITYGPDLSHLYRRAAI
ncbi:MAG: hypothetical protein ACW97X_08385, partial [Candidatus Hodarchaeales archaeon]